METADLTSMLSPPRPGLRAHQLATELLREHLGMASLGKTEDVEVRTVTKEAMATAA